MNILAFDTSFGACSAAVAWATGSAARFERMERGHAERLVPMIGEVIAESPIGIKDVERIVVSNGPGTFTGVRIAIACARALALATGAKIATASSLHLMSAEVVAQLADQGAADQDVAIAVDARRDEVYFQLFGGTAHRPLTEPLLVSAADAAALLRDRETFIAGSGAARVCDAARATGRSLEPRLPDLEPNAFYLIGLGAAVSEGPLRPRYLRPPDAKPGLAPSLARLA